MAACWKCSAARGRRNCPVGRDLICPACCARHRGRPFGCPHTCPHLETGHAYHVGRLARSLSEEEMQLVDRQDEAWAKTEPLVIRLLREVADSVRSDFHFRDADLLEAVARVRAEFQARSAGGPPVAQEVRLNRAGVLESTMRDAIFQALLETKDLTPADAVRALDFLALEVRMRSAGVSAGAAALDHFRAQFPEASHRCREETTGRILLSP